MKPQWSTWVSIETLEVKRGVAEVEDWEQSYSSAEEAYEDGNFFGGAGYASFNDDGYNEVYAESLVSQDHADELVFNYCISLAHKLNVAAREIYGSKKGDAS